MRPCAVFSQIAHQNKVPSGLQEMLAESSGNAGIVWCGKPVQNPHDDTLGVHVFAHALGESRARKNLRAGRPFLNAIALAGWLAVWSL